MSAHTSSHLPQRLYAAPVARPQSGVDPAANFLRGVPIHSLPSCGQASAKRRVGGPQTGPPRHAKQDFGDDVGRKLVQVAVPHRGGLCARSCASRPSDDRRKLPEGPLDGPPEGPLQPLWQVPMRVHVGDPRKGRDEDQQADG
jgi:hypothetical protein